MIEHPPDNKLPETDYHQATIVSHLKFVIGNDGNEICYGNGMIVRPKYGMDLQPVGPDIPWECGGCRADLTPNQYTVTG